MNKESTMSTVTILGAGNIAQAVARIAAEDRLDRRLPPEHLGLTRLGPTTSGRPPG